MQTALHLLLLLIPYRGYAVGPYFSTETKAVGQIVSLSCPYRKDNIRTTLFWIRLVSGTFPEFLAHSEAFKETYNWTSSKGHHIIAKQEAEMFVLQISQVQKSDMAVYYCFKWTTYVQDVTFLKGIFLQVKDFPEAEPSVLTVTQDMRTDGSQSGQSVTLKCSVFPHSENQTCFDGHKIYWFRTEKNGPHPSFIYTREECEKNTGGSMRKCVQSFSKNISSSDAGNYLCAVATCGEIFMKHTQKIFTEGPVNILEKVQIT
ncbi:uncharacterized protein LOC130923730 [Corythoichthys intestinalis]|uniref:uncharacterized protein LOC130923730 n=1 Tax=Corythoichthys intestinalis TaxID=161448 RepID=UPI0025A5F30B|nr:uncharacterized protein LOC130923730 [Corythoichthys intestinalis]